MTIKLILTDIEGTTSSISFVKDVLFPYAAEHLPAYVRAHSDELRSLLADTAALSTTEGRPVASDDTEALIQVLLDWISADKKATPLKTLQGLIWQAGYESGAYRAHMYPDATAALRHWHACELPLYVYSSGSVAAQKLFFAHSEDGNLLPLFSGHFDTQVGGKREAESYRRIAAELQRTHGINAAEMLFLSDIKEELDAARAAGLQTAWLVRDEPLPAQPAHPAVASFSDLAECFPSLP
ncbi:acireductone synthase [Venatoribacter cucullus]|uniref:acireductone synthase n=1 Tax=Venatoribacter cucullus TaxID=2661630 RepID=UPI00223F252A|nr:acireductone synthase [Venatoribacter cucullus]UZK02730.1 acireductone synthase [Venatoribacter cucullus]